MSILQMMSLAKILQIVRSEAIEEPSIHATLLADARSGERFGTNRIVLEDNEYILTRGELVVKNNGYFGCKQNDQLDKTKPKRTATWQLHINAQQKSVFLVPQQTKLLFNTQSFKN